MTFSTYPRAASEGEEIDLIALIQGFWTQKWLITLVTLLVTLGAASYAFLSKPVYESRLAVLPPTLSEIAGFNVARDERKGLKPFSVDDIYSVFTRNLQAEESRQHFFREVYLPSLDQEQRSGSQDRLYKEFGEVLTVKAPSKKESDLYVIAVESHNPVRAAEWAKLYLEQVTLRSLDDMLKATRREVEVKGEQIRQEIKSLREVAKVRRHDRLSRLREALVVAEGVGLENPPVISGQMAEQLSAVMNGDLMYMRGAKALSAEIEVLENRTSDDPFIPSLRSLEEQYNFYASAHVIPEAVSISRQDGAVVIPDAPIKPRKVLILVLGMLLGGILGLFIALVRLVISKDLAVTQRPLTVTSQPIEAT